MAVRNILFLILALAILTSCGGDNPDRRDIFQFGSADFKDTSELVGPLSAEEMSERYGNLEGTWLLQEISESFRDDSTENATILTRFESESLRHITYNNQESALQVDICNASSTHTVESSIRYFDRNKSGHCEVEHYAIDKDRYLVNTMCKDRDREYQSIYTKVSDIPSHDSASLTLESNEFGSINATTDTCVYTSSSFFEDYVDSSLNGEASTELSDNIISLHITAPYGEEKISVELIFVQSREDGQTLKAQIYPVRELFSENTISTDLWVNIRTWDTTSERIKFDNTTVESGSLTLDSVSDRDINGTFSFTTESGDTVTGSFTTNLSRR